MPLWIRRMASWMGASSKVWDTPAKTLGVVYSCPPGKPLRINLPLMGMIRSAEWDLILGRIRLQMVN